MHLEALIGRRGRHGVLFDFETCKVVVLQALREGGATVRRQSVSADGERVAQDGSGPAMSNVRPLCVSVVAARVFGQRGLATEGFAASLL